MTVGHLRKGKETRERLVAEIRDRKRKTGGKSERQRKKKLVLAGIHFSVVQTLFGHSKGIKGNPSITFVHDL